MKKVKVLAKHGVVITEVWNKNGCVGRGVARCNKRENDTFDETVGKILSLLRAKRAYKKAQKHLYDKRIQALKNEILMYQKLSQEATSTIEKLEAETSDFVKKMA